MTKVKDTPEVLQLLEKAQNGCSRSENKLVIIYAPYVEYMVSRYSKKTAIKCDDDLRSYINMGLLDGIRKFDPSRNSTLIYFAHIWMKKSIFLGELSYKFIHIPINQRLFYAEFLKEYAHISCGGILNATDSDLVKYKRIVDADVGLLTDFMLLDESSGFYEFPDNLLTTLQKDRTDQADKEEYLENLKRNVKSVLASLTEKEAYIINNVFGLSDNEPGSIEQIAKDLGVTKVNITFTKARIIRMLRHKSFNDKLLEGL